MGMFLSFSALSNVSKFNELTLQGDVESLKSDWKVSAPFVFVDVSSLGDSGTLVFESFTRYTSALEDVVLVKLPELMTKASRIIDEAEDVRRYAEPQFDNLDLVSKGKAIMAMSFNMKMVTKIPGFIKGALEEAKGDLDELKEAINQLKLNMPKLKTDGVACAAKNVKQPLPCYRQVFGPIRYTRQERVAWELFMEDRCRARGVRFNRADYPDTDMITDDAQKA